MYPKSATQGRQNASVPSQAPGSRTPNAKPSGAAMMSSGVVGGKSTATSDAMSKEMGKVPAPTPTT